MNLIGHFTLENRGTEDEPKYFVTHKEEGDILEVIPTDTIDPYTIGILVNSHLNSPNWAELIGDDENRINQIIGHIAISTKLSESLEDSETGDKITADLNRLFHTLIESAKGNGYVQQTDGEKPDYIYQNV